jgi:hypothetical protein
MRPIEQVQAMQARQDELERLYEADGRHDRSHPLHAHYTGLYQASNAETAPKSVATVSHPQ